MHISKPLSIFDKLGFASWLILGDEFLFLNHFFIFRFFVIILCYFVTIHFYKNLCYHYHFIKLFVFFSWKLLYFFMFRDVPACSSMFRNVPCSGFYRRPRIKDYLYHLQTVKLLFLNVKQLKRWRPILERDLKRCWNLPYVLMNVSKNGTLS